MQIKLTMGEQARLWEGVTQNIQAYDKFMRGVDCINRNNEKDNKQAQHFLKEAISIDKKFSFAHTMLGMSYILDLLYRWSKSPLESFEQAELSAENALALNDSLDMAHILIGWIYLLKRQHKEAIKEGERAVELNPNGAFVYSHLALFLCFSDKTELAIKLLKRAFRLNPIPSPSNYIFLAIAYRVDGQYEKAIEVAEKGLKDNPDQLSPYLALASSYSLLNRDEDARKAAKQVLRIDPNFSLDYLSKTLPYKNQETLNEYVEALRKAGLPD
ncbi:MAG: tetratricopeptide repeat protein [Desulfobacterales bacterium]|nr:tetratricopeptide repeat protein [Desulfobacterales bacterium]